MENYLILLAGYPATGKTYLADLICEEFEDIEKVSPDDYKMPLWKKYGFRNLEEKDKLVEKSWEVYYDNLTNTMAEGKNIVSEYPFSNKQKDKLIKLSEKYNYNIITIRLIAEFEELYQRHLERDVKGLRDIVYNVSSYNPDNPPTNPRFADDIVDREEFYKRYSTRGYGEFKLGSLIEVDTTDFSKVNYTEILKKIHNIIT